MHGNDGNRSKTFGHVIQRTYLFSITSQGHTYMPCAPALEMDGPAEKLARALDAVLVDLGVEIIKITAQENKKANPVNLALRVPGLCHSHLPRTDHVESCAWCRRNGNVCADGADSSA